MLDLIPAETGTGAPGRRRRDPARARRGHPRRRRRRARPRRRPGDRGHRPDLRRHDQPAGLHRRRGRRGAAGGARLRDVEFIQFHPTVLFLGTGARGQLPLVSEAVRGEGGLLVNRRGERFMVGQHELAELAPRDVVAKGIMKEMAREGSDHVYVDGRMLGEETWRVRFPTILDSCRVAGHRPGHRPDPGRAGRSLLLRRRRDRPRRRHQPGRALRVRRGRLVRGARRQPARVQLAARGPGLRARGSPGRWPGPAAAARRR